MNKEDLSNQLEGPCGCFGLVEKGIKGKGMGSPGEENIGTGLVLESTGL